MGMSKKDMLAKAEALVEAMDSGIAKDLLESVSMDNTAAEISEVLTALADMSELDTDVPKTEAEELADLGYGPIWKVGQGQTFERVIARDQGSALAKAAEINPLLLAIGMVAEAEETVEGFPVVALIPEDYKF